MLRENAILCGCMSYNHALFYMEEGIENDSGGYDHRQVSVIVTLKPNSSFLQRLILATRYLFGKGSFIGMYDEFIVNQSNVHHFSNIVNFIKYGRQRNKKNDRQHRR